MVQFQDLLHLVSFVCLSSATSYKTHMRIGDFKAWISIDDVEQTPYAIEYSPDNMVATCWIASEQGKKFSVSWKNLLTSFASSGRVFVDGQDGGATVLDGPNGASSTACRKGYLTSATTIRHYMFAKLELTDDDRYLHTATSPELGEIKLEIKKCRVDGDSKKGRKKVIPEPDKIHERSKKAMDHRATFGPEAHCHKKQFLKITKLGKVATFVFKYRPLAQLQANGIVPLEKGRKRVAPAGDVFDLTEEAADEDEVEAQRIKALREELSALERSREQRHKRVKIEPKTEVKKEPKLGRGSGGSRQLGDVIDLT
ncbi:hypothetical protein FPV67DRAFT_925251 [Lyophyllum atratum]|nr:hypothetical protein FPV67DRAFT_925251 [Lyophyllum atratum]